MIDDPDPSVPSGWMGKVSILLGVFSMSTNVLPSGLTEIEEPRELVAVRVAVALGIC